MNNIKNTIEFYKSINQLAHFLEVEPSVVITKLAYLDIKEAHRLAGIYNSVIDFYEKPFEERAKELGFEVEVEKEGEELSITTIL
jgi:hypothetical protein